LKRGSDFCIRAACFAFSAKHHLYWLNGGMASHFWRKFKKFIKNQGFFAFYKKWAILDFVSIHISYSTHNPDKGKQVLIRNRKFKKN